MARTCDPVVESRPPRIARRIGRALLLGTAACLAASCAGERGAPAGEGAPVRGGTAVVCLPTAPGSLDPFVSPDLSSRELAALLYTPLVRYGTGEAYRPYLARSWRWSADRRALTFDLRTDVTWHDGERVTALDVAFTIRRAADPAFGYPGAGDFAGVDTVVAGDSATVTVRFGRPPVSGLEPFADGLPILPAHLLGGLGPEAFAAAAYHHEPVGSGPYRLAPGSDPGGGIRFERWDGFPEELGPARLDALEVRVVPDAATREAELRSGGVDACVITASQAAAVDSIKDVRTLTVPPVLTQFLILDTARPPVRDVRVRRAISAAIDREELAAVVSPAASPARGPLPAGHPYADPDALQPDADSALADSLLTAAGWRAGDGSGDPRVGPGGRRLDLTVAAPPQMRDAVTVLQAQLGRAGIRVEPRLMDFASLVGVLQDPERRPPAVLLGSAPAHRLRPDFYTSLVTGGPTNASSYSSAEVDSAVARLASTTDSDVVAAQYRILQERVAADLPVVYTIRVPHVLAVRPRLRGVEAGPAGPFAAVGSWWIPEGERRAAGRGE